jgi:ABC-2 type transport system permease protein
MVLAIVIKELQKMIKDRGTIVYLLVMPMVFMVIFHFLLNQDDSSLKLNLLNADKSVVSQQFVSLLKQTPGFQITELSATLPEIKDQITKGKISHAVILPEGFGDMLSKHQPVQITVEAGPKLSASTGPIVSVLTQIAQKFAEPNRPPELVQVKVEQASGKTPSIAAQIVPGYTVMFVFYIMISILKGMFKERESGILERIKTTPLKSYEYMLGMWIPQVIAAMIQITVLFTFGHFLLDLELSNYGLLFLLSLALSLCATALGMMLTMLVKSDNHGMALVQIVSLGGAAVGGLWMPVDMLPDGMQKLAHFLPQYWAMQGYQAILFQTGDNQVLWNGMAVLTAIAIGAIGIAATRYKQFAKAE